MSSWWCIVVVYYVVVDVEAEGNKGLKSYTSGNRNGIISPEFITHKIWVAFSQKKDKNISLTKKRMQERHILYKNQERSWWNN